MAESESIAVDDTFADELAAYDERLRNGTNAADLRIDSAKASDAKNVLRLLEMRWPTKPSQPQKIGRFEIRESLGEGTFGQVFRAFDPQLGRDVAIKIAKVDGAHSDVIVKRFVREAKAVAGLRHPQIVPLFEFGQHEGVFYIVFAHIAGRTLQQELARRKSDKLAADPRWAARVVAAMADALAHAHALGIVHRDVKPANALIDAAGVPLIADFGLAASRHGAERLTHSGQVLGTPLYMAPEQAIGRVDEVGPASDQYSLGIILYELIAGRPPFVGPPEVVIFHHLETEPPSPRTIDAAIPRDLETICLKCLQKEPGKRYASCRDMADDLRRWLEGSPIKARPVSRLEALGRWLRKNRATATALAALACVLIALGVLARQYIAHDEQLNNDLIDAAHRADIQKRVAADVEARNLRFQYANALRGAQSAVLERNFGFARSILDKWHNGNANFQPGLEWFELRRQTGDSAPSLPGNGQCITTLCFSRDGTLLAGSGDGPNPVVKIWDPRTEVELHSLKGHRVSVQSLDFNADGKILISADIVGECRLWDTATGASIALHKKDGKWNRVVVHPSLPIVAAGVGNNALLLSLPDLKQTRELQQGSEVLALAFSPDGFHLAAMGCTDPEITLSRVETGEIVAKFPGLKQKCFTLCFSPDGQKLVAACDRSVGVWNVASRKLVAAIDMPFKQVRAASFIPGSKDQMIVAGDVGAYVFLDLNTRKTTYGPPETRSGIERLHQFGVAPSGQLIALPGARNKSAMLVESRWPPSPFREIAAHDGAGYCLAFTPDSQRLVTGGQDRVVHLWDAVTGAKLKTFPHYPESVVAVALAPKEPILAAADEFKFLRLTNLETGKIVSQAWAHTDRIARVAFSHDGRLLASASWDKTCRIWNPQNCQRLQTLAHPSELVGLSMHPSQNQLATICRDRHVRIWNADTGELIREIFTEHPHEPRDIAYSNDGQTLWIAIYTGEILAYDLEKGDLTSHFVEAGGTSISLSPDGRCIAAITRRGHFRILDRQTKLALFQFDDPAYAFRDISYSPNGRTIATVSQSGTLFLWKQPPPKTHPR